ncbi:sulfatase family protein [Sunxiuqinia elliptica]|uniref:Arylsulfatase A-like enzyme n=1 Tax=Sunxiuqinia elliptica TaxID=655355 RepID=A0A4R6GNG0_9BACT|nr:arylsulfatase [Sunxiuqinia elliptica]TDN95905.1 arylsulfatase A-like enzyme [Sunxiuqinia elliptica]TDO67846.1 arylsulfatase A-like enzyme [Sunxiuqinia elliptica]
MRRRNIYTLAIGALAVACNTEKAPDAVQNPNIVIILADDLGYGDVQHYNTERGKIPTPNLDRLAAQGMSFTDAHSSSAVCSPSRYSLLTGRYHWRSRLQKGIVGLFDDPLITPDRLTVAGLVKQQGYQTACIGKWHLGWDWPIDEAMRPLWKVNKTVEGEDDESFVATDEQKEAWQSVYANSIDGGPTTVGFDHYFGTDVPNWPPYCFIEDDRTIGIPSEFLPKKLLGNNMASMAGPAVSDWKLENILPELCSRAAKYITESAQKDEPFLLYLPLTSPHTPLAVNEAWDGKSKLNRYADFVMETDAHIGRVLDAIEKSGESNNTLIIFTSDNGCAHYIGANELETKGHFPSGPWRGYKSDVWEGGHRVPFIVKWPGVVEAGSTSEQLVQQVDIMATLADVIGVKLPDNAGEDSFSLMSLLKGNDRPVRDNAVNSSIRGVPSVRQGEWKLILDSGSGGWTKGESDQEIQLYNLTTDPGETTNLVLEYPEKAEEMKTLLEELIVRGRSTPGEVQDNDVEVVRYL